ncbi:MAG: ABC transporter permease [Opitutales bacterium]|nr:ABC transporter permease [Opitutales bacterium]
MKPPLEASSPASEPTTASARRKIAGARKNALRNHGWRGTYALLVREIQRFMKIAGQSIVSPVLTTLLYFVVFGFSLGSRLQEIEGIPYIDFLVPGLMMLNLINNAFLNSSFSLFIAKIHGAIVDVLVTPLTPLQIIMAYVGASVVRAVVTGLIIWLVASLMGAGTVAYPLFTIVFMLLTAIGFALFGIIVAIYSETFDQINLLPSFFLMPLTFLGGVFYSISMLPPFWQAVSLANPILYMINGLRYGMTGVSDVSPWIGLGILTALVLLCGLHAWHLLHTGKKLRE